METKHTPGPCCRASEVVEQTFRLPLTANNESLIAAAPELLEALRDCLADAEAGLLCDPDNIRAAIAKAEGR